ncbi:MAG: Gfo/Idh/MocA family oxidoreductase [Phycisphaeraceae bacterium]
MKISTETPRRVLVIGTGSIGERHVRCLQQFKHLEIGICEVATAIRRRVATEYQISESFSDLEEALASGWDIAVIATPAQTHVPIATRCVEAGIHLLIEKPLAVAEAGVAQLVEQIEARELLAGVAYVYRSHPALVAMREAVRSGRFGRPVQVVASGGQHFPLYRPEYRDVYYADHAQGGGAIQDALTHVLNAAEWLVGPIDRILADAEHKVLDGVDVEDTVHALTRHGSVMGCFMLNQHQSPNELSLRVICEEGTCDLLLDRHLWRWMKEPDSGWKEEATGIVERDDWFSLQHEALLNAMDGNASLPCDLREGLHSLKVNRAALASAAAGGVWKTITQPVEAAAQ